MTDHELLAAAQRGDEGAFATLHERYRAQVYRIALGIVGHHEDAEDICQEVFLRLHQHPPTVSEPKSLASWLARVTANTALNLLRSRRRARFHWLRWLRFERPSQPVTRHEEASVETTLLVRSVLERLPERDRVLLALRTSGLSYEEIAEIVGIRPSSVGTLLARAERRFRTQYELLTRRPEEVGR